MRTLLFALLCLTVPTIAQEKVTLDQAAAADYRVSHLALTFDAPDCQVYVVLKSTGTPSRSFAHSYSGQQACQMLQALNKADLSTKSLQRRIIERLITDKVIAGTVSGSPE